MLLILVLACSGPLHIDPDKPSDTQAQDKDTAATVDSDSGTDAEPFVGWPEKHVLPEQADHVFLGETPGDRAAKASAAGDVDGDGLPDLVISAEWQSDAGQRAGKAYVLLGKDRPSWGPEYNLSETPITLLGENAEDLAGHCTAPLGDLDGDGRDELMIGSYSFDGDGFDLGRVYLLGGDQLVEGETSLGEARWTFTGEQDLDRIAHRMVSPGDVDGDGLDDILIGAAGSDRSHINAGAAYYFNSAGLTPLTDHSMADADTTWLGESAMDDAGYYVGPAGDIDGDGLNDLMVGARNNAQGGENAGKAYIVLASSIQEGTLQGLDTADLQFVGSGTGESCYLFSAAGDVDADGLGDIIIGSSGFTSAVTEADLAHLFYGAQLSPGGTYTPEEASFRIHGEMGISPNSGVSVSELGDIDGDQYDDLFISRYGFDDNGDGFSQGYVLRASDLAGASRLSLDEMSFSFEGSDPTSLFGRNISPIGDFNLDGRADLLIGDPQTINQALSSPGRVLLFLVP